MSHKAEIALNETRKEQPFSLHSRTPRAVLPCQWLKTPVLCTVSLFLFSASSFLSFSSDGHLSLRSGTDCKYTEVIICSFIVCVLYQDWCLYTHTPLLLSSTQTCRATQIWALFFFFSHWHNSTTGLKYGAETSRIKPETNRDASLLLNEFFPGVEGLFCSLMVSSFSYLISLFKSRRLESVPHLVQMCMYYCFVMNNCQLLFITKLYCFLLLLYIYITMLLQ